MVDGVVEGVLLDPGQRAHPVVDASGRWVFDEGDQYPGAHPTVSAEGEWVSDDRDPEAGGLDRVVVSAPGGVREPWEYRPPSSGSESYFGAPGDLWAGMVDWWFSHDIPTEGLPSGGGLMVGPLEMAKLGNFLKDALLPLMAGDIGLAGVGGLGPFDPLPLPFGKVIGEGVKGAKWVVKAVKAVGKGDDVVAGLAKSVPDTPAFYGIERLDETGWGNSEHDAVRGLFEESGESLRGNARMLSPDDPAIPDVVYHVTASGSDIAEEGVLRVGKDVGLGAGGGPPERLISFTVSREVAERLAADFELRRQVAVLGAKGDRAGVSELLRAESRRWGIEKSTPERVEELTGSSMWGAPEGQGMEYEWEYYLWEVHPEHGERELEDALGFFLTQRGRAGGPRNPLFMVGAGHIGRGEPEPLLSWATKTADDIQILAVPKENLAASGGAVVDFDLGKGFLEEIRVYGDVPVPAGGVARETGETAARGADEAAEGGVAAARALDTEDVPIEFFDDMQGNPGVMAGEVTNQAKVDKLAASIAEDGITEPLILEFHPGTGLVWLGEGNHRLAAARQLGLDSVPVRGVRYEPTPSEVRLSGDGKRLSPYTLEHLNNDDWFGEAWVSESGERLQATFTPSQVGVPTAGGVARETGEATARTVVGETAPTLDAFTEMAGRGKLHPATGRDLPGEATATNPFEFGVINGYSEDDIAHFYLALRAPWNKARTARNVGAVRDDMRELAYEQFLEDRAEYLAKQSGAPLGSVHRQLSDEIGKADVVRGESGEMMLEVDDVEAFDAALKAWEEANPVTPFTEAMERLDPPAGGVARETGEAAVKDAVPEGKILADQRGHAVSEDLHGQPGSVGYADVVGESQYVDFIEVRLPATFMEDHIWNRSLPGGVEVKSLKTVWVRRLTASDIREIYSDADFYSDAATAAEMGLRGLAASARATVKALRKALGVPEGAPFPSRAEIEAILAAMGG